MLTLAFAEDLIHHVRVDDVIARLGRMRIFRDDPVGRWLTLGYAGPSEPDLERAKINISEYDGFGRD
jgi:hypothetical protein